MATPPKPPKDPKPPAKPAARRAPRATSAQTTRRTEAPKPPASKEAAPAPAKPAAPRKAAAPRKPATSKAADAIREYVPDTTAVTKSVSDGASAIGKAATSRTAAWSLGAVVVAAGAGLAAFLTRGRIAALLARAEGHEPVDLVQPGRADASGDIVTKPADERAPEAFRPDMDAPMTAEEREALRPPPGPGPSLTSVSGTMNSQTGASN